LCNVKLLKFENTMIENCNINRDTVLSFSRKIKYYV